MDHILKLPFEFFKTGVSVELTANKLSLEQPSIKANLGLLRMLRRKSTLHQVIK